MNFPQSDSKSLHSKYQPICLLGFDLNNGVKEVNIEPRSQLQKQND